jgi:hypothetical protein
MHMDKQSRRAWLKSAGVGIAMMAVGRRLAALPADTAVTVYKDPNCGCCKKWVSHLESNGFKVTAVDRNDMNALKDSLSVPTALRSCHTAVVGKLIVEGHVPAADVRKAMTRVSKSMIGVAVPGMPAGSPGMEMGGRADRYDVIAFDASGATKVFATHG